VFLTLATASAASAAAVVYLAHNGDQDTNWLAICNQFGDFCAQTSSAVVSSFVAVVVFVLLIVMSALAIGKPWKLTYIYKYFACSICFLSLNASACFNFLQVYDVPIHLYTFGHSNIYMHVSSFSRCVLLCTDHSLLNFLLRNFPQWQDLCHYFSCCDPYVEVRIIVTRCKI